MVDTDSRLIIYAVWATGSVLVWGRVFSDDVGDYIEARRVTVRDRRAHSAIQILLADFALLLVAIASAISILTLVIGQDMPGLRGFALALALGAFFGAGLVKATFRSRKP